MGQIFPARADADTGNTCLAGIVTAVGAEAVAGELGMIAHIAHSLADGLHEITVGRYTPGGKEPIGGDDSAGIALLLPCGEGHLGPQRGIVLPHFVNDGLQRRQHTLAGFAHQQTAVKGHAAIVGHHRRAGIRRGADVRQLQNPFAEHALLLHRRQGTEAVDDTAGGIHRVDALFRVGAVAGHAVGLQTDLRAAALGALDIHFRRLADDHQIRFHGGADLTGGHALEALLMHRAGHPDLAGKIAVCQTGKALCGKQVRRHGALHIRGAAPVKAAVLQFGGKGIMAPVSGIVGADGIYMAVK